MNNSVFGKTMENIRSRVDVQLVNNQKKANKLISKPNLKHWTRFDENLIAVHLKRIKLTFNKPVYCGMAILDISKTLIYDFHYKYIVPKFGEKKNSSLQIRILSAMRLKQKIFLKILWVMLMQCLIQVIFQRIMPAEFKEKTKKFLE